MEGPEISIGELEALMQLYKASQEVCEAYYCPEIPFTPLEEQACSLRIAELQLAVQQVEILLGL